LPFDVKLRTRTQNLTRLSQHLLCEGRVATGHSPATPLFAAMPRLKIALSGLFGFAVCTNIDTTETARATHAVQFFPYRFL
jgi:hypothetical protein